MQGTFQNNAIYHLGLWQTFHQHFTWLECKDANIKLFVEVSMFQNNLNADLWLIPTKTYSMHSPILGNVYTKLNSAWISWPWPLTFSWHVPNEFLNVNIFCSVYPLCTYIWHRDAIIVSTISEGTSIFAGLVTFAILGVMSEKTGVHISKVVSSGKLSCFINLIFSILCNAAVYWLTPFSVNVLLGNIQAIRRSSVNNRF